MAYLLIFALLGLIVGVVIAIPIVLAVLAIFIYVVTNLYPWLRKIAIWCARPANMAAFGVIAAISFVLAVLGFIILPGLLKLGPILLLLPMVVGIIPVQIGLFVWGIRLTIWTYRLWRGLILRIYAAIRMQTMKAKIKVDVGKETEWKIKWSEMKSKLSEEAEQARRKVSRRK